MFILNPPEDVFSLHGGNANIADHKVCFRKGDEGTAEPPHLLKGEPQGYTSRNIIGGKKTPRDQVAGLSYSSVFSFHSGKERTV